MADSNLISSIIPSGTIPVKDEGATVLVSPNSLNFIGSAVSVTNNGNQADITIIQEGAGDVIGPGTSTLNGVAVFAATDGASIKDAVDATISTSLSVPTVKAPGDITITSDATDGNININPTGTGTASVNAQLDVTNTLTVNSPSAGGEGNLFIEDDGSEEWGIRLNDPSESEVITEFTAGSKAIQYGSGAAAGAVLNQVNEYDFKFKQSPAVYGISNDSGSANISYKVYGLGDNAEADSEFLSIGWDNTADEYVIETGATGTGIQKNIDIRAPNVTIDNLDTDIIFEDPTFIDSSAAVSDTNHKPTYAVVIDKTVFTFGEGPSVFSFDITDADNLQVLKESKDVSGVAIQTYIESPADATQTRVNSTGSNRPVNSELTISGGLYAGTYIVTRTDPSGDYFDIDVVFTVNSVGTTFTSKTFGDYSAAQVMGNYIVATSTEDDFYIYSVESDILTDVGAISGASLFDGIRDLYVYGQYVYVTCSGGSGDCGIVIVDVTDVTNPFIVNTFDTVNRYWRVIVSGTTLYGTCTTSSPGLVSFDISNPTSPVLLDSINTSSTNVTGIEIRGNIAVILEFTGQTLNTFDISDPSAIVALDSISVDQSSFYLAITGTTAVVTRPAAPELVYIDFSNPALLVEISTQSLPSPSQLGRATIIGNSMYLPAIVSDNLIKYELTGRDIFAQTSGTLQAEELVVNDSTKLNGNLNVLGSSIFGGPVNVLSDMAIQGRELFGTPNNVVWIKDESDFPEPSGSEIFLEAGFIYKTYNPNPESSTNFISLTNTLVFPDNGNCYIESDSLGTVALVQTGAIPLLRTNSTFQGSVIISNMIFSAPIGSVYDIDGVTAGPGELISRFSHQNVVLNNFLNAGLVRGINFTIKTGLITGGAGGSGNGLSIQDASEFLIDDVRFEEWQNTADTTFLMSNGTTSSVRLLQCIFRTQSNETALDLIPTLPDDIEVLINSCESLGDGETFKSGITGTPTFFEQYLISDSITGVTDVSGNARFDDATGMLALAEWQEVTLSGFSTSAYNVTLFAINVTTNNFQLSDEEGNILDYVAPDTGNIDSDVVSVTNADTGLVAGDKVNISGTINYNGGAVVAKFLAGEGFLINRLYVIDETPTNAKWDTGSLTPISPRVSANGNVNIQNSEAICAITAQNDAMDETVITTESEYVDFVLTASTVSQTRELDGISRWVLVEPGSGQVKYTGREDITALVSVNIGVTAGASAPTFLYRLLKNDTIDVGGVKTISKLASNSLTTIPFNNIITATNGDVFRMQVANIDGTQDLTIPRYNFYIR